MPRRETGVSLRQLHDYAREAMDIFASSHRTAEPEAGAHGRLTGARDGLTRACARGTGAHGRLTGARGGLTGAHGRLVRANGKLIRADQLPCGAIGRLW